MRDGRVVTGVAFVVSMVGTGVGMYFGMRFVREYMP